VDHEGESVMDLMLANGPITKWLILADDHATGSDHEVVEWEVEADRHEEADHERVVGWDLAAMKEEDSEAAEKLWANLAKERAHLDAECTEDEVEQEATWSQEVMSSVLIATAKKVRICLVLAPVVDRHFGCGSGSEPNHCQIGAQGCHYTRTVNSATVRCKSPNPSELGGLSAGRPAGPSVDLYNVLVFAVG